MNITILKKPVSCPCELCKFVRLAGSVKIPRSHQEAQGQERNQMTTETPCLNGCRKIPIVQDSEDCMPDYRLAREVHAEGCPNAPKPAVHLHGCKAAGLHRGEPGYELCNCPNAKPAEPPACMPGCRPVYSIRIMSGPIQGDQIDHWPNCPNTPNVSAEPPACKCGADDFNGRPGRVGKTAVPHAQNCPKRAAEPQGSEPPIARTGGPECLPACYRTAGRYALVKWYHAEGCPNTPKEIDWDEARRWAMQPVVPEDGSWEWRNSAYENAARAYLALKAERDTLKAESARRLSLIQQYEAELPKVKAENAALKAERDALRHDLACLGTKIGVERRAGESAIAENAALKARVERYEDLILAEACNYGECITVPHAESICKEARAIRARKEQESKNVL